MQAGEPVWIALGANLGARERYLAAGRRGIAGTPGLTLVAASTVVETAPVGPEQPAYLNQMVLALTALDPGEVLDALQAIERDAGRRRTVRWGPRTLDLDIVRFGERRLTTPRVTVPHPELPRRPFWSSQIEELAAHVR